MKKIGVVIGASRDAIHTIQIARKHGIYVVALDGNKDAPGLSYADQAIVVDISKPDSVLEVVKRIQPDFTIPIPIGKYLTTTGFINDKLGLKGINELATVLSTDKYKFHTALQTEGLRDITCYLLEPGINHLECEYPIEFPAIIKPRFGSGSRDVFYCADEMDLKDAFRMIQDAKEHFILEEAVQGEEYSIDGAVMEGKLVVTLLRKKEISKLPERQPISSIAIDLDEISNELSNHLQSKLGNVVKALNYDNCLVNADLIIQGNEVFVIEISPRPSGHNLHNVFVPYATGVDLAEEYIKYLLEKEYSFRRKVNRRQKITFFSFENVVITKVPTEDEIRENIKEQLVHWECTIQEGDFMNKITNGHSIMGRGFFILEGNNEEELDRLSNWVLDQFGRK